MTWNSLEPPLKMESNINWNKHLTIVYHIMSISLIGIALVKGMTKHYTRQRGRHPVQWKETCSEENLTRILDTSAKLLILI